MTGQVALRSYQISPVPIPLLPAVARFRGFQDRTFRSQVLTSRQSAKNSQLSGFHGENLNLDIVEFFMKSALSESDCPAPSFSAAAPASSEPWLLLAPAIGIASLKLQ